jgi:hypothetical protein
MRRAQYFPERDRAGTSPAMTAENIVVGIYNVTGITA